MKSLLTLTLLIVVFTISRAQQSETRNPGSFSAVRAAEGIDVYLKHGDKESIKVEVSGTTLENVITEVSGGYLKIHMKEGRYKTKAVKVYVTYVQLDKLSASSAANIYSEGIIKTKDLSLSSSSAGSIEVTVEAGSIDIDASSAGEIDVKGKSKSVDADASSAGEIDAYDLEAEKVTAEASSGASVKVNSSKELEGRASSGGSIKYRGNPAKTNTNSSSGGSVKKAD